MSYRGDGPPPPAHPTTDPWTGVNYQAYAPPYGYHYGATPAYGFDPRYYGPPQPPGTEPAPAQVRDYYRDDRSHAGRSRSRSAPRQRADSSDRQTRKETYKSSSAKSSSRSRSRSRDKRYITKYERSDSSNTSHSGRSRSRSRDSSRRSASRDSVESDKYHKNKKHLTSEKIRKHKDSKKYRKSTSPDDRILQPKIKQEKKSGKTSKAHHSKRSSVTPPRKYPGRESSITPPKSYMKCRSASNSSHESRSRSKHRRSHSTSRSTSKTPKRKRTPSRSSSSSSRSASDRSSSSSRSKSRSVSPKRNRRHRSGSSNNRSQSHSSHRRHKSRSRSVHSRSGSNTSSEDARRGQFTVADRKRYWKLHKTRQEIKPAEPPKEIKPPPGAVETVTADDIMYGDPPEMEGPNFAELLTYDSAGMPSTSKGKAPIPIRNDGSFLEMFKKMQEINKKETEEQKPTIKKPMLPFIGKRRGGKVLKTGLVKKAKAIDEQPADDKPKDAWSLYMQEVKKYRETSCEEEQKTRPLVK